MSDNDRLFPHRPDVLAAKQVRRRQRMRGERDRSRAKFDWHDENRYGEHWDECAAVTVAVHGKLVAE